MAIPLTWILFGCRPNIQANAISKVPTRASPRLTLAAALAELSAQHREVLELVFAQGFALAEVAQILAVPVGTVKSRVSYARRALLKALAAARRTEERACEQ